jgi:hypothetical protein
MFAAKSLFCPLLILTLQPSCLLPPSGSTPLTGVQRRFLLYHFAGENKRKREPAGMPFGYLLNLLQSNEDFSIIAKLNDFAV